MQTKRPFGYIKSPAKVTVGNIWTHSRAGLFNQCSPCIWPAWYKPIFQPIAVHSIHSNEFTVAARKKQLHSNRNNYMNVTNGWVFSTSRTKSYNYIANTSIINSRTETPKAYYIYYTQVTTRSTKKKSPNDLTIIICKHYKMLEYMHWRKHTSTS